METKPGASGDIIFDLRRRVLEALPYRDELLLNLIDALTVGPRLATPSELPLSPLWGFEGSSLYSGLRGACDQATLAALRQARLQWWQQWGEALREPDAQLGDWQVRVLDATNYDRPKTRTVRVGYVHQPFQGDRNYDLLRKMRFLQEICLKRSQPVHFLTR